MPGNVLTTRKCCTENIIRDIRVQDHR
jgi:hypothetical protein